MAPDAWPSSHLTIWSSRCAGGCTNSFAETLTAKEFDRLDAQSSWDEQVTVCSTQMVKGLEYDAVMVVQPGSIEENAPSRIVAAADLYVAMTRPTQRLLIVRTNADENCSSL